MGLVDYASDSDSDPEPTLLPSATTASSTAPTSISSHAPKKSFQKLLDRSNPGQILVSLPTGTDLPDQPSEPPAKRARTEKSTFSNFNSFLPAPKRRNLKQTQQLSTQSSAASRPTGLKTASEAAFVRGDQDATRDTKAASDAQGRQGLGLPPPKNDESIKARNSNNNDGPMIPEGQKPADEVILKGKATMFKPLSVARRPGAGAKKSTPTTKIATTTTTSTGTTAVAAKPAAPEVKQQTSELVSPATASKKVVSLFSFNNDDQDEESSEQVESRYGTRTYQPIIETEYSSVTGPYENIQEASYVSQETAAADPNSLAVLADSMGLSASERRELFGRGGTAAALAVAGTGGIAQVDMGHEYAANEELRMSGEAEHLQHNPLRAIQPGKHSLRQLVSAVQNQRDALEESFAKGKTNKKEAAGKYGWK